MERVSPPPRLVLDTNTVMALWFFEDPGLLALRNWLESGAAGLLASAATLEELQRVLAYRQFAIPSATQLRLADDYRARIELIPPAAEAAPLPLCRDRDDQKFLELARDGMADYLLSRDKAVLRVGRHRLLRERFTTLTPERFQQDILSAAPASATAAPGQAIP